MKIATFCFLMLIYFSVFLGADEHASSLSSRSEKRPNVVLIMADDLGVEGIGCYGGTSYRTPAIDQLAKQGIQFQHAYAQPLCTNTRVQLMTGLYNNRNWKYFGTLDPNAKTIGHFMQDADYSTCMAGKWQLQSYDPPSYPGSKLRRGKGMKVTEAGFDEYSLFHAWHTEDKGSRYRNPTYFENGQLIQQTDGGYGPDHWVRFINDFIERKKDDSRPFFVYYSMALPHRPFAPTPDSDSWNDENADTADDPRHFPDMVEYMDQCVGKVIQKIDDSGLTKNTIIIFYSDNGTHQRITSQTTQGNVDGGKGKTTDAGTHVPLVVRWPGKVTPGLNNNLVDSTDFLPTILEAAGRPIPKPISLDGISFYPQLIGTTDQVRPWVFCHYDPRPGWDKDQFRKIRFVRNKQFKLYGNGKLFDVTRDRLEKRPILHSNDTEASRDARQRLAKVLESMPNPNPEPRDGNPRDFEQRLYLAAGNQLSAFKVDPISGDLEPIQQLELNGAGPFTFAPNRKLIYATARTEDSKPAIATIEIQVGGRLKPLNRASVDLRPGYLMTDNNGEFLAGSHYGPGKASVWRIDPVYSGDQIGSLSLEKNAHSAVFSPDNRWLLVPATGPNKIFINRFTAQVGTTKPHDPSFVTGPTGAGDAQQPRHLVFHPNLSIAYTTNERDQPGVCVWNWNTEEGTLVPVQNIVTLPEDFEGRITTADLHMTPDAKFLYVSNRDNTDRKSTTGEDSIVGFSVDSQTGLLKLLGHFPCERIPRSFTIDQLGKYLYVAGQGDSKLGAYRIEGSGELTKLKQYKVGRSPIWIETISIAE
ncbi:MAG: beta-propeller fold lactonase family protein [Planctomycetota bacterium]